MPLKITLHSLPRAFIHIDCDSFFASVEQALNPALKGKPVITGKERGIAAAMSIEAKKLGIQRAMRLHEIVKAHPEVIILPNDYEAYSLFSRRFFLILRRFTPEVEEYSIDEAFAELTGLRRVHRCSYEEIALKIKHAVEAELGITVSVGLSLTKSIAKICSRENKPSGFTCVKGYALHEYLQKIPTERVCGFGPNTCALLAKHGVRTVWDYVARPVEFAKNLLGKIGVELWHELRGEALYEVAKEGAKEHQASLSKTKTFTPPSSQRDFVRAQLLRNLESAFIKLRRHRLRAGALSIFLTNQEFRTAGLYADLTRPTSSTLEVLPAASELFEALFREGMRYRRTGVVLHELGLDGETQLDLFESPCRLKAFRRISKVVDEVNALYGKHTLHLGATDCLKRFNQHLGERGDLTVRKTNPLKGENFRQHLHIPVWNVKV